MVRACGFTDRVLDRVAIVCAEDRGGFVAGRQAGWREDRQDERYGVWVSCGWLGGDLEGLTTRGVDQQLGQLYELMQAIQNKERGGDGDL